MLGDATLDWMDAGNSLTRFEHNRINAGQFLDKFSGLPTGVPHTQTRWKPRLIYKGHIITEYNNFAVNYMFKDILSLRQDAVGDASINYDPNVNWNGSYVVYANNTQAGYRYQFQWKSQSFDGDPVPIDENGFQDVGNMFEGNNHITFRHEHRDYLPLNQDWFYVVRLAIYRGTEHIGFSNVVFFKTRA